MEEERIPTFIPGDYIEYLVTFDCPANVRSVTATFRNESTGTELVFTGSAYLVARPRIGGTRTQEARLRYQDDFSFPPEPGRYRLASLEAVTYGDKLLDFENPPADKDAFRFEAEPDDPHLPRIVSGSAEKPATQFLLDEGHPNTRPPQ